MPQRTLLVCLGNICRSPMAVGVMRAKARAGGFDLIVEGAGTAGYHEGEPPDRRAVAAARARGYDISMLRARRAVAADFGAFDHILVMDKANLAAMTRLRPPGTKAKLGLLPDHAPGPAREVPDPYYDGSFDRALDLIEAAADGFLATLR
ncbi:MAG: low molecular weight protein-tyrosine-phosphatase [Pikeienuella sp.]